MKPKLYFCEHADCRICNKTTDRGFKYIETRQGEKYVFEMVDTFRIAFILEGEALVSCNEHTNVLFRKNEALLWPIKANCAWESLTDTAAIVLSGDIELAPCDREALKEHAELWLNSIPEFKPLHIKPRLKEFLHTVKNYLDDGIACPYMHKTKQRELSTILRAYYPPEDLMTFFLPTVQTTHEFEYFIMNNYLEMKGVKEFVDLSGMNLSTFNRKFKAHFKETPYQWLIKQKSKHIYHELTSTNKSFIQIARQFQFTDASHFNRYCKGMFGAVPSQIRKGSLDKKEKLFTLNNQISYAL